MSIIQTQTTSFISECYQAGHNLLTDAIFIALYNGNASLGAATTVYSSMNEIVAAGYTAGGKLLTNPQLSSTADGTVYVSFDSPSWTAAITARGALVYNTSRANKSIAVLNFGADKTSTATFTVTMPAHTPTTALIRSATI